MTYIVSGGALNSTHSPCSKKYWTQTNSTEYYSQGAKKITTECTVPYHQINYSDIYAV